MAGRVPFPASGLAGEVPVRAATIASPPAAAPVRTLVAARVDDSLIQHSPAKQSA